MKLKRLLSCALVLALALTATALPAAAATTFPDIATHWGKIQIEEMTAKNMFKGYDDGTFRPEGKLSTAEALALCARVTPLEEHIAAKIATDRKEEVESILAGDQAWFNREFAICLELGILTHSELQALVQSGALSSKVPKTIAKEDLSRYLVRAMQLGPMAERLDSYSLAFTDKASISAENQPFVYLLNIYGIVQGDQDNAFLPNGAVTRAVMATMLSRSLAFMTERGVSPDLAKYTTYEWQAGTIAAVSAGDKGVILLTLNSDLTGATNATVSLSSDVKVYENNMISSTTALKVGRHVRVSLDSKGTPDAVRVGEGLTAFTGKVNGFDGNNVAMSIDGVGRIVSMNRFTQVQVGAKTTGGIAIVDPAAGYTSATCQIDDQGRLVSIHLVGGTRQEEGIFSSVEKGTGTFAGSNIIRINGFDGVTRQYTAPAAATITINGLAGTLGSSYAGCYTALRVSNEDNSAVVVTVDTVTKYIQGGVRGTTLTGATNTISITDLLTGKAVTYTVSPTATITYNGAETLLKNIQKDYFITGRLSGGDLVRLDAYPGAQVTEGVITNRVFDATGGSTVTLEITLKDKSIITYKLDLISAPEIKRDGVKSTVDKLRMGDNVVVTVRYSAVTRIEATPQTANMIGTINRIIQETGGSTLEMTLADGTAATYVVSSATSITQNGKAVALSSLKPGYRLAMVVNGDQLSSVEIQQVVDPAGQITGTIILVNVNGREILLRVVDTVGNEELVTVTVASGVTILDLNTGKTIYLKDLSTGELLQVNGTTDGANFEAKVILRK